MSEPITEEGLQGAEKEALELRHSTGAHRWIYLCNRTLNLVREVRRCHTEAAGLREELRSLKTLNSDLKKARDRAMSRLREEEGGRAQERAKAEEMVMRKSREVMRKSRELARLRERVGALEGALARFENWLEVTATYAVSKPKRDYAEFTLKELRAALSQVSAREKLETRSEEGRKSERT